VTTTIGDVEACQLLGAGSDTVIFEGRTTSNVPVVIKYSLRDPPLKREAETLKILNDVIDIPKLLYENFNGMIPYIVTSMMGQKVYKVNARVACNIIIDILGVLKNLHGHNYIHNDIHPSNIVNVDGKYRLIDFGRAVPQSGKRETAPDDWPKGHIVFASHNWDKYPGAGDDLEALCYTVTFMHDQDKEYWRTAIQDPFKALHEREKKLFYLFDDLPQAFKDFYDCVYDLDINAIPDYEYWQTVFVHVGNNLVSLPQKRSFSTPPASPEREHSQL
jgi:serine/threonine protein kinase